MKFKAKLILSVCVIVTMLVSSFPVLAAEGDGVIFINAAAAGSEVGIKIDGKFSDWEDKAALLSPLYYDLSTQHGGILYRDADYVYFYLQMADTGYTQFNGYGFNFTVDGTSYIFDVVPNSGSINDGKTNMKVTLGGSHINKANAIVWRSADNYFPTAAYPVGDQMEMAIPLTHFSDTPESIVSITFNSPSLGSQTLSATGTPTLPFVLAATGLLVATFGYFLLKRKRAR
jgi:uncharacterized protein (TIGR04145 family)